MPETTTGAVSRKSPLRALYDFILRIASTRFALPVMVLMAMVDASIFFSPPDILLAPMVLGNQRRAALYATIAGVASVCGGILGYTIGHFAQPLALKLLAFSGREAGLAAFQGWFAKWGLAVILVKGLTPVPYMIVTLASGIANFNFAVFVGASIVTRFGRFGLEALLLSHPQAKVFVERHLTTLFIAALALIAIVVVGFRLVGA